MQLVAVIEPDSATNKEVIWSSDAPEIVSVNEEGWISALSLEPGSATISVSSVENPEITDSVKVIVHVIPGIGELKKGGLIVYPNPVSASLLIQAADPIERVEIFSVAGERVLNAPVNGLTKIEIERLNLEAAPYLVRISMEGGETLYKKIVVVD